MSYLPSLPPEAVLVDVFRSRPELYRPLIDYHEVLLRGPSPLSVAERELIAAYVSGLNECRYCHGVHSATACAFGVPEATMAALLADVDSAPVEDRLKPLLAYARKLTLAPATLTDADAAAVRAAGWEEQALHDTVAVCALFNMMNRLVEGLGIAGDTDYFALAGDRLHAGGYAGLRDLL
ncbi:MAG TPA: peroxidase-related enzyme [Streptosporangiaceae bacterium]|nr:peroxidase-related enzyme [Streptosporangiaceae bacterium]